MISKIRNKRGDTGLALFAIFTVVLVTFSLISLATITKRSFYMIHGSAVIREVKLEADSFERAYGILIEEAFVESYIRFVEYGSYMEGKRVYLLDRDYLDIFGFSKLSDAERQSRDFNSLFEENYKKKIEQSRNTPIVFDFLDKNIGELETEEEFSPDSFKVNIFGVISTKEKNEVFVKYPRELFYEYDWDGYGLVSFNKLYEVKEECKLFGKEEMKNCFEKELSNFNVNVREQQIGVGTEKLSKLVVELESKKNFLSKGKIKVIFIPV